MTEGDEGGAGGGFAARVYDLIKEYGTGDTAVRALNGVTVGFPERRFTAIMGPSGSGKSTLLHCMAGLDRPTSGRLFIGGTEITNLPEKEMTLLRRERLGFVFQQFNLLPTLTALENITFPLDLAGRAVDRAWLDTVVGALGLADRLSHRPSELSGGQQQRVAVARALVARPGVVVADEPTGNLDSTSSADLLGFLRAAVTDLGQTVVMVTHDPAAAAHADLVLFLVDGRFVESLVAPTAASILDTMKRLTSA